MLTPLTPLSARQVLQGKKRTIIPGEDSLWLVIDSNNAGISQFYQFLDFLKRSWQIEENSYINLHIALSEAVMNAVDHGNKKEEGKSVYISANRLEEYYIFTIEDEGEGFNYNKIANPTDKENREKPGGRGIFIMNYFTDNIHYSENGRCVKLLFNKRS